MTISFCVREENTVGKRENAAYQGFPKSCSSGLLKVRFCVIELGLFGIELSCRCAIWRFHWVGQRSRPSGLNEVSLDYFLVCSENTHGMYREKNILGCKLWWLKPLVLFWNTFTGMFLGDTLHTDRLKNMAAVGGRLFALYGHEEILKKSSSLKSLVRIGNNFTRLFLLWPFSIFVCEILIRWKTWLLWGGGEAFCTVWT